MIHNVVLAILVQVVMVAMLLVQWSSKCVVSCFYPRLTSEGNWKVEWW
jgi:hypothetical protein